MANLKYKNSLNEWKIINNIRGPEGPAGPKGDNAIVKLNGNNTTNASFYAPVESGIEGQILKSHGGQVAPTWEDPSSSLTNVDNLTETTFSEEKVLSAHQGYVLNQNKVEKSTTVAGIDLQDNITIAELVTALKTEMMLAAHPIGSYYWSSDSTNPSSLFGGTWEAIKDRFILAAGSTYSAGTTGGSAEMQLHSHSVDITSGNNSVGHTHSVGAHSHGLNSHTHSIPALSGTASSSGSHSHKVTDSTTSYASGSQSGWRCLSWSGTNHDYWQDVYSISDGSHTHAVTTTASTTGAASGNTANSTAFNTGGVSANHTHSVSGNTGSSGSGDQGNMPPYIVAYCWRRTA